MPVSVNGNDRGSRDGGDVSAIDAAAPADRRGRGRILREARALFTAHGFASVSMQQIADAAAVNKATLYHHFRDKEDLFLAVMCVEFGQLEAGLHAALAGDTSLRDQLRRGAVFLFRSSQSDFGRLMSDLRQNVTTPRRDEFMTRCAPPWQAIRAALERAAASGDIVNIDPDLAARLFFVMVVSQTWLPGFGQYRPPLDDRLAETITAVLLDGIGRPST
jgi:AcrR family transcriptional regulator